MSRIGMGRFHASMAGAFLLGSLLLLACQPAQPAATPKPAEKGVATPVKPGETPATAATKPAAKAAEKPVRGGTLRIAAGPEFASLDPNTQTGNDGFYSLYDQLIEPAQDGSLTKDGLVKDWTVGSDGKSIAFKLREGVKFHDGSDFDAAALKFNVDRMKDPNTKSPFREYYEAVASAEVVDPLTVRLNLSRPDVLLLPRLATQAGGMIVSPTAVQKHGNDFPRNPVGTGPFQFVEWKAGDRVTLKRFEGYWGKDKDGNRLPYLDGVVFQFITDETTAVANLRTGQIELMANQIPATEAQRGIIKADPNLTYRTHEAPLTQGVTINTQKAPFDNKAVRQAVALAVDRQGMGAFFGEGVIVYASIFNPTDKAYDDGKSGIAPSRDLAKAKAKMAEAGSPGGSLKVTYTATNSAEGVKTAEIVKANLAEIGIDVGIEAVANAAWNTKVRTNWDYQMSSSTTNTAVGDPGHYLSNQFHSKGSRNYFGPYSNSQVDEALDKATRAYDQKERTVLYNQAAKLIIDDAPFVPIYVPNRFTGMSKKVQNFSFAATFDRTKEIWLAQ